eukprot:1299988-Pleurochrysis_carterae.AAC.1
MPALRSLACAAAVARAVGCMCVWGGEHPGPRLCRKSAPHPTYALRLVATALRADRLACPARCVPKAARPEGAVVATARVRTSPTRDSFGPQVTEHALGFSSACVAVD